MIPIAKLTKTVSFSVSKKDKQKLQQKAKNLEIPLARMIRNIVLEKYKNLTIGFVSPGIIPIKQEIDIKILKRPPKPIKLNTKENANFKECVQQLKDIFNNGIQILGKIEDSELGIKNDKVLDVLSQKSKERMILRYEKEKLPEEQIISQ